MASEIPYSIRDKSFSLSRLRGLNFNDININEMFKKKDDENIIGANIYSVDGRIGIGVQNPEEDLELDGNIQLDTGGAQRGKIIFYDKRDDHEHAEIDGLGEGTNGGVLAFYTKRQAGSVTEKLRINNKGALGIGGANYGTAGQVIVSNGPDASVSWADTTDTTYTAGSGINISGTNVISNTAPDQVVSLTGTGATTISGTYPTFTINSTDTDTTYTAGSDISIVGTTINNTAPDQVVSLTGTGATTISGTYPTFTINSTDTDTTYTAGSDISIVGTTINNTAPDQIVSLTGTGATTVSGTYPTFTINSTDTNTTYSNGTGVSLVGTTFSIGQSVETTDSVEFKSINLKKDYFSFPVDPLITFEDPQAGGILTQIQSASDNVSGGQLKFFTKQAGGSLTERLNISQAGVVQIKTDGVGLLIASLDGVTEQGYIYNSGFGTKDFIMDAAVGSSTKGITFRTGSTNDRMRISDTGNVGIGTITPQAKLDVDGDMQIKNANGAITYFNFANQSLNYIRGHLEVTNSSSINLMGGQNGGTGRGLYFYSIGDTNWGQYLGESGTNRSFSGGTATGGFGFTSFAMRFRVGSASLTTGWIFEDNNELAMFSVRASDGLGYFRGPVYSQTGYLTSDDRIKFNEKFLTDGLEVIRQLVPQEYMKSKKIDVEEDLEKEIGLIAQEVKEIPQLEHVVVGEPDNPEGILNVNYTQIFVYGLQAIKELDVIVSKQQETINALMARIEALENK